MKTVKTNKETRELINQEAKEFRLSFSPIRSVKELLISQIRKFGGSTEIILGGGEVIVFSTLIVTVGSCIAYGIYKGYSVSVKRVNDNWYLIFKKI